MTYHVVEGGLPAQSEPLDERAIFTEAYAVLPGSTMTDIVASAIPHWHENPPVGHRTTPVRFRGNLFPLHHGCRTRWW